VPAILYLTISNITTLTGDLSCLREQTWTIGNSPPSTLGWDVGYFEPYASIFSGEMADRLAPIGVCYPWPDNGSLAGKTKIGMYVSCSGNTPVFQAMAQNRRIGYSSGVTIALETPHAAASLSPFLWTRTSNITIDNGPSTGTCTITVSETPP
jgi:hypothetical protein